MTRPIVLFSAVLILAAGTSFAQSPQPYAGMQTRPPKALSSEELADLESGRGMGLALAGELNGYPGPRHVLELAKELNLTDAQRARTQQLFDDMKAEAVPLGQQLIAAETDLDRQFSGRTITAGEPDRRDRGDRRDAGNAARHASEISPRDDGRADARTDPALRRIARLWRPRRRPDIRRACTITRSEAWRRPSVCGRIARNTPDCPQTGVHP